ncbi:hypothetical protein LshimejAT787_0406660 [Lyophyllum shimeji]|uniref:Uncharacterized protein n=1 Tax=Lyophyllum shimeji TaxID=47721 RepID=A0A9P3UNA1_LYOSH|nr:hypothetical protein LshimejAT787_0406660 [Lyophyllum shimeji]
MPSSIVALPLILLLHAYTIRAAPLISLSPDPSDLSRRGSMALFLGITIEDPCATLQILRDENDGCATQDFLFFDRLLESHCDRGRLDDRSLLGSGFKFVSKHGSSKAKALDIVDGLGGDLRHRENYDHIVDRAFLVGELERSGRHKDATSINAEPPGSDSPAGEKHRRQYRRDRLSDDENHECSHEGQTAKVLGSRAMGFGVHATQTCETRRAYAAEAATRHSSRLSEPTQST